MHSAGSVLLAKVILRTGNTVQEITAQDITVQEITAQDITAQDITVQDISRLPDSSKINPPRRHQFSAATPRPNVSVSKGNRGEYRTMTTAVKLS